MNCQMGLHHIKRFTAQQEKEVKTQSIEGENTFAGYSSDSGLISRIY
jgi:hypothetical protein